jgi:hypothetical protein
MTAEQGVRIDGFRAGGLAGQNVAIAGDVNGDGYQDILIGAPGADVDGLTDTGEVYVVFGRKTGWANINLADVQQNIGGFAIDGDVANARLGAKLGMGGDFNATALTTWRCLQPARATSSMASVRISPSPATAPTSPTGSTAATGGHDLRPGRRQGAAGLGERRPHLRRVGSNSLDGGAGDDTLSAAGHGQPQRWRRATSAEPRRWR